jgi:solute:Na+ symporter, SSS family
MVLSALDWIEIATYFAAVFAVGFYFARRKRTSKDYFLAGGNVGWAAIGASIFATNIGSEHLIGLAGSGARSGLAVGAYELSAVICIMFLAWVFLPYYLKSGVFTMPEYLERRYTPGCRWGLTIISLFAYIFTKISVGLFAGAILIKAVTGWDIITSALILVIGTGVYTVAGGLAAVIYTDLLQAVIFVIGSVVLMVVGLDKVGGFEGLRAACPPDFFHMVKPLNDPVYPALGTTFGIVILGIWYWCTDQVIVQRVLAGKDLTHARGGAILAAWLKILPLFIFVVPGLIALVLWPEEVGKNPDQAYPLLITRLIPKGLIGIMIAVFLAALMSSLASVFNSCSTLITMDIYHKIRPRAEERTLVRVGRLTTAAIVIVSIVWIPMIRFLSDQVYQYLQSIQAYIGAPIATIFLIGVFWKRATGKAAIITLITGGLLGLIRFITDVLSKMGMEFPWPFKPSFAFLNYSLIVSVLCVAMMIVISLLTPPPQEEQLANLTFSRDCMSAGIDRRWVWVHGAASVLVLAIIVSIWAHFA